MRIGLDIPAGLTVTKFCDLPWMMEVPIVGVPVTWWMLVLLDLFVLTGTRLDTGVPIVGTFTVVVG